MSYTASRLKDINKFEAHQQIKKLRKKGWEDMDEDDFSEAKITSMLNKPKPSSRKRPVPFPQDVKKTPPVKRKQKDKYRRPLKSVEETEQKDMEEQESASEASEIKSSDSKSSEDECSNLGGIKFTVKRGWEGQVNLLPGKWRTLHHLLPRKIGGKKQTNMEANVKQKKASNFREAF